MPRRPPPVIDPTRRLVEEAQDGSTGKLWNGTIYIRGMEDELPEDFPMDGPHWEDWIPEPAAPKRGLEAMLARQEAAQIAAQRAADGVGLHENEELEQFEGEGGELTLEPSPSAPPAAAQPMPAHPGARRARGAGARSRGG